jgi:hypothetical protein
MSDLIIQNFALALPFAELAAHICFHNSAAVVQLYRTHVFVNGNRLFNTEDLSATLETITLTHLKVKLGVNSWRHVSTAFRRKLCNQLDDLIEQDSMDSVQAVQSGHSRQTENRVYALSQDSFAGVPEDLLPLFLKASTDWQNKVGVFPGGTMVPYSQALAINYVPPSLPSGSSMSDEMCNFIDSRIKVHVEAATKTILDSFTQLFSNFSSTQTAAMSEMKEKMKSAELQPKLLGIYFPCPLF